MNCFKSKKEQIVLLPVKEAIKIHKKASSNFYREERRIYKNKDKGRIVKFNNKHWSGTTGYMADDNYYYICLLNRDEVNPDCLKLGAFHFEFKILKSEWNEFNGVKEDYFPDYYYPEFDYIK